MSARTSKGRSARAASSTDASPVRGTAGNIGIEDGCAPPPFTEKVTTYRVRLRDGIVEVDPTPLPRGTPASIVVPL